MIRISKEKTKRIFSALCYLIPPLLVATVILWVFHGKGVYPFGNKSISWCDMDSQVIPMLCNLKDVLSGKTSLLYSAQNAGGMNFLGVFYYYVSSPFHLLVAFVPKTAMPNFANILVLLKLCAGAFTAFVYFRHAHPTLARGFAVALSVFYGCCGYAMAYYQILLWMDAVYLFPLLLLGLTKLLNGGKPYLYVCALVAFAYICFYLTFMFALFILLYAGVWAVTTKAQNKKEISARFLVSSALGVLLSLAGSLPLLLAYGSSARQLTDIVTSIKTSGITSDINTSFPLLLSTLAVLPFFFFGKANRKDIPLYACLAFTLFSVIYEPTNRLWHFGAYMMFPARYAFIPCFLPLAIAGARLTPKPRGFLTVDQKGEGMERLGFSAKTKLAIHILTVICVFTALGGVISYSITQSTKNVKLFTAFPSTLMGNVSSYQAFLSYYGWILLFVLIVVILYRLKMLKRVALIAVMLSLSLTECAFSTRIYMAENAGSKSANEIVLALEKDKATADKNAGQAFYRVKESRYNYLVNYTGAAGYNSLSHYTSMTDKDTMRLLKQLGYESCWMEVGSHTGTVFTDALFAMRYQTVYGYDWDKKASYYSLQDTPYCLPLGVVTSENLSESTHLFAHDRVDYLKKIYSALCPQGRPLITEWKEWKGENAVIVPNPNGEGYIIGSTGGANPTVNFFINVTEKQTLYLEVYDQGIFTSTDVWPSNLADVYVNGRLVADGRGFPYNLHNGFLT
ncbi:MAG: YfhO family protein, partial [Clostridia bacterium]|nr:YfhO family protein [Clostridia bacterium]